jgi:4-amino-4-deoxy-L-arabinose transferase-like glycosyltransferase
MKSFTENLNKTNAIVFLFISIFLIFAVWSSLSVRPESDEGSFASPALNLAENGHFGTTVFEMEHSKLTRINERTYWVMPLFLLNAAAVFKVFGFSLIAMRSVSIFWGIILLISWYFIILKFSDSKRCASLCLALMASSYVILATATIGRGDTMCAALGFSAIAAYLWQREKNLMTAVLFSQILVVASGMTHYLGILPFLGLLFLTLYFDRKSLTLRLVCFAAMPYLIVGSCFGWWVLQDPVAFKDQFIDNATASGRMEGFSSPLSVITREFTVRYPRAFGLLDSSPGHSGPIFLKSLMLVGYALGMLGVLFTSSLRRKYSVLLTLIAIYFLALAVIDGQKLAVYLIYIVPFYLAALGIWIFSLWENRSLPRTLIAFGIAGFLFLGIGGIGLRSRQNTYGNFYQPAIDFLNKNASETDLIMGGQETRFALRRNANHIADGVFGMRTGKRPQYIIYDPGTLDSWNDSKTFYPEFYEHLPRMLNEEYKIVYENTAYKIYKRHE